MFSRQLHNSDPDNASRVLDAAAPLYRMGDYGYGKQNVRVFQLKKDGPVHSVVEFKVSSHMRLSTHKEYYNADNTAIVGSDVQESTIYVHAQKYGFSTPEEFALSLTQHFLDAYEGVEASNVIVEDVPWDRLGMNEHQGYYKDKTHNHVFTRNTNCRRFCEVVRKRGEKEPLLLAGISDLRMVKTARAPFTGYVKGALFTEGDMPDRILCVDVNARWQYSQIAGIDFSTNWLRVRELILRVFAGDPVEGNITTSVQWTSYTAERAILDAMPEICSVSIDLPNYRNFPYDFSRFPPIEPKADVIITNPVDVPRGIGYARLDRLDNGSEDTKL